MLRQIITGGQSGVDRAAGDVAAKLGIPHSPGFSRPPAPDEHSGPGMSNPHRRSADGESPPVESTVLAADGVLVITSGDLNPELERIRKFVQKQRRPWLHIDLRRIPAFHAATMIGDWITQDAVEILYVTGSASNVNQKIYEKTYHVLTSAYWLIQGHIKPGGGSVTVRPSNEGRASGADLPVDVPQAVGRLAAEMSLRDRTTLANMTETELHTVSVTLGAYIRNNFGIWTGNAKLMESCRRVSQNPDLRTTDASSVIIRALWEHLKKTHKLRVIK
jgi:hypothetical protein